MNGYTDRMGVECIRTSVEQREDGNAVEQREDGNAVEQRENGNAVETGYTDSLER